MSIWKIMSCSIIWQKNKYRENVESLHPGSPRFFIEKFVFDAYYTLSVHQFVFFPTAFPVVALTCHLPSALSYFPRQGPRNDDISNAYIYTLLTLLYIVYPNFDKINHNCVNIL